MNDMGKVFLNSFGDGHMTCVPPAGEELVNGELFTIYFVPDGGATLDDVRAFDSHDYSVALPAVSQNNTITMNFRSGWGNLYVDAYFSGSPTPPSPVGSIPIWLLKKAADKNNRSMI